MSHITNGLTLASDGKLYGVTTGGGANGAGVIFNIDPSTNTYRVVRSFNYGSGGLPCSELIQLSNGKLYGVTSSGGLNSSGVIYSFDSVTSAYLVLHHFNAAGGNL